MVWTWVILNYTWSKKSYKKFYKHMNNKVASDIIQVALVLSRVCFNTLQIATLYLGSSLPDIIYILVALLAVVL